MRSHREYIAYVVPAQKSVTVDYVCVQKGAYIHI